MDDEIALYDKKYTRSEFDSIRTQRVDFINKSIQDKLLYNNITFTTISNPLKYSVFNSKGKSADLNVYPDIRTNTGYYSNLQKENSIDEEQKD